MVCLLAAVNVAVTKTPVSTSNCDRLLMPKTEMHYLKNIGKERLYALCMIVPNEDFSELIRNGIPASPDKQDLKVLSRIN